MRPAEQERVGWWLRVGGSDLRAVPRVKMLLKVQGVRCEVLLP